MGASQCTEQVRRVELVDVLTDSEFVHEMEQESRTRLALTSSDEYIESCKRLLEILTDTSNSPHTVTERQTTDRQLRQQIRASSAQWTRAHSEGHRMFVSWEMHDFMKRLMTTEGFSFRLVGNLPTQPEWYRNPRNVGQWEILHQLMDHPVLGGLCMCIDLWHHIECKEFKIAQACDLVLNWKPEISENASRLVNRLCDLQIQDPGQTRPSCIWLIGNSEIRFQQTFLLIQEVFQWFDTISSIHTESDLPYHFDPAIPREYHREVYRVVWI